MSHASSSVLSLVVLSFAIALSGCASAEADEPDARLAEGLTLDAQAADHVSGRFEREGVLLQFDFSRDAAQDRHVATLRDGAGNEILSSVLVHGVETVRFKGGALTVSGVAGDLTPRMAGNEAVLAELNAEPAVKLLPELQDALNAAGFDRELHTEVKSSTALSPQKYYAHPYWRLGPGESQSFPTWGFFTTTRVGVQNFGGTCVTVKFNVGWSFESNVVAAGRFKDFVCAWGGVQLTVTNVNGNIDYGNGQIRRPNQIGVFTQ